MEEDPAPADHRARGRRLRGARRARRAGDLTQSGWPTPMADVQWRNRTVGDVLVFGVTPPFVVVQDYVFAAGAPFTDVDQRQRRDRKSTRLNSSHGYISYAVFCLKKKKRKK